MTATETEAGEMSIGGLAASARSDRQTGIVGFLKRSKLPMLCLAPTLVVLSLASVVIPIATILITTSQSTTATLSSGYLGQMMSKIDQQVAATLIPLKSFAELATTTYVIEKGMALTTENDDMAPEFIATMTNWRHQSNIDIIGCFKSRWRPGYGLGDTVNVTSVEVRNFFALTYEGTEVIEHFDSSGVPVVYAVFSGVAPPGAVPAVGAPGNYALYGPLPGSYPPNYDLTFVEITHELLLPGAEQRTGVFFTRELNPNPGQDYFSVSMGKIVNSTLATAPDQGYGCSASLNVDATYNALLKDARPTNDTVIIILDNQPALNVISSTLNGVGVATGALYSYNSTSDPFTTTIQQDVIGRYQNWANIPKNELVTYSSKLGTGSEWIVMISGIKLTEYDTDILILVSATPRSVIFGAVDTAQKRSLGLAIGLSLVVSILIAAMFGLVVVPLHKLAIAMGELTQLNFGALQDGKLLGAQSFILELSRVQLAFSTMVKAFAAGIKANRSLAVGRTAGAGSNASAAAPRQTSASAASTAALTSATS